MPIDTEVAELLDIIKNGAPFDGLRAARQLERLTRKQRLEEREQQAKEKGKAAATK